MVAAAKNKTGCTRILADKEARILNSWDATALMEAGAYGHLECVKIRAPLEVGMIDDRGRTAKSLASSRGRFDCVAYLSRFECVNMP